MKPAYVVRVDSVRLYGPFRSKAAAERFADQIVARLRVSTEVLLTRGTASVAEVESDLHRNQPTGRLA